MQLTQRSPCKAAGSLSESRVLSVQWRRNQIRSPQQDGCLLLQRKRNTYRKRQRIVPCALLRQCGQNKVDQCATVSAARQFIGHFAAVLAAAVVTLTAVTAPQLLMPQTAHALLNSPNARIARSAEVALRRSIPAQNAYVRGTQSRLEGIQFKLRIPQRKPWGAIGEDAFAATATMANVEQALEGVPGDAASQDAGKAAISDIQEGLRRLNAVIAIQDPSKVSFRVADVLKDVAELELLQAPGLPYVIPREYASLPHLTGRAVVEFTVERVDGSAGYVTDAGGGLQSQATMTLVIDGYSAPVTGGNFVRNVLEGVYCGLPLSANGSSVTAGRGALPGRTIPLEALPSGQFDLVYRSPLDVRDGELPVLPLSIYGALAMSHAPGDGASEGLAAADEFFIFKFDRQSAGLSGLSFEEGEFGVFGYITKGTELIPQLSGRDIIKSARLVSGGDRLANAPSSIAEKALRSSVMFGLR